MSDMNSNPDKTSRINGNSVTVPPIANVLNINSKNSKSVVCQFCDSKVLTPDVATLKHLDGHFLPAMRQKKSIAINGDAEGNQGLEGEDLDDFWMVEDMFLFENVGFSKAVNNVKYLICADCEMGPIGFHDPLSPKEFYVALARVQHK